MGAPAQEVPGAGREDEEGEKDGEGADLGPHLPPRPLKSMLATVDEGNSLKFPGGFPTFSVRDEPPNP